MTQHELPGMIPGQVFCILIVTPGKVTKVHGVYETMRACIDGMADLHQRKYDFIELVTRYENSGETKTQRIYMSEQGFDHMNYPYEFDKCTFSIQSTYIYGERK
jgi:hypothetical protein